MAEANQWSDLSEVLNELINRIKKDDKVRFRVKIDLPPKVRNIQERYGDSSISTFATFTDTILRDQYLNTTVEECLNKLDTYKQESLRMYRNTITS